MPVKFDAQRLVPEAKWPLLEAAVASKPENADELGLCAAVRGDEVVWIVPPFMEMVNMALMLKGIEV